MTLFFHSSPAGAISKSISVVLLTKLEFCLVSSDLLIWFVSSSKPTVIDNRTVYLPGVSKRNLLVSVYEYFFGSVLRSALLTSMVGPLILEQPCQPMSVHPLIGVTSNDHRVKYRHCGYPKQPSQNILQGSR